MINANDWSSCWGIINVTLIKVLWDLHIVVKLLKNTSETIGPVWLVLNDDDNVVVEKLRNNVILLLNDSLDDDSIIEKMIWLIWFDYQIYELCGVFACSYAHLKHYYYAEIKYWLSFTVDKKSKKNNSD